VPLVTDNFNRGTIGGNWTTTTGNAPLVTSGSTVVKGSAGGANNCMRWSADSFLDNHYAQVTLDNLNAASDDLGPCIRIASGANTFYYFAADKSVPACRLYKVSAGTFSQLGADYTHTPVAGTVYKLDSSGSTLTPYINGVAQATRSDSGITSGWPGIFIFASTIQGDSFEASDGGNVERQY